MRHGLVVGRTRKGERAGLRPKLECSLCATRLGQVMCQHLRPSGRHIGKASLKLLCDAGVQLLAAAPEQAAVGRLLNKRVLEDVTSLGWHTTGVDHLCFDQLAQRGGKLRLIHAENGRKQSMLKLPPNY